MKNVVFKSALLALTLACLAQFAAAEERGSFTRTLKVSGEVDLNVTTGSGNIHINRGTGSEVVVNAKIFAGDHWFSRSHYSAQERVQRIEQDPPVKQNGNSINIGRIDDPDLRNDVSISYDISVPASTHIHSETGSGDQEVRGVAGPLRASTGSGNIQADEIENEVRASTGSGDVRLNTVKGRVYANTGSGNIEARGISGGLLAETGSGDIYFDQQTEGDVSAHTGSGNVELHHVRGGVEARTGSGDVKADGEARNGWNIHTSSGTVEVKLPPSAAFDVDAHSSSGEVTINHPVTVQGSIKKNHVQGKVGNGGALVQLQTGSGDIRIN